ncbi:hypothetical protein [Amycolatopsis sp. NPDC051903]|uniref:hypothetical protein n=1 Tax=Amycolatopsis sp. NPDC051903 TaxID=3363936 RepID=UPI0037906497
MVSGYTDEHLQRLVRQYRKRSFVNAELWAGKVVRAVRANTTRLIDDEPLSRSPDWPWNRSTPASTGTGR